MNTRQSIIAIILMTVVLGLADGNPSPDQLKVALIMLAVTVCYTIAMVCKNNTNSHEHKRDSHNRNDRTRTVR